MAKVRLIFLSLLTLLFCSCEQDGLDLTMTLGPYGKESRQVLLLYGAGFNSLSSDIWSNIDVIKRGYLPGKSRNDDVVLVFSHLTKNNRRIYSSETAPVLIRLYNEHGEARADTLRTWPVGTPVANKEMMTEVFNWVREAFPADGYGAIMSSHATGVLPVRRPALDVRGARLHGVGSHQSRVHQAACERRDALHPHRVLLVHG